MKHSFILCLFALVLAVCCGVAQEKQSKVGIGISLNPSALLNNDAGRAATFLPVGLTNIYLPIMPSARFRIEPEVGIYSFSSDLTGSYVSKSSSSSLRLGIGLFYVQPVDSSFDSYLGPRLGILRSSSTMTYDRIPESKTIETDFFIGACVGGEYSFSSHFSIGGEAQLNYINYSNPDRTPASPGESTRSQTAFTTNAIVFFRLYF